jgi:hypothetical protein
VFGNKEKRRAADAALLAEVERLEALSMTQLATEVMVKGFGPGAAGGSAAVSIAAYTRDMQIVKAFNHGGRDMALIRRLYQVVDEALLALENSALLSAQTVGSAASPGYALTRLGRDALQSGTVERVLRGETP